MPSTISPLEGIDSSNRVLRTSIYLKNSLNQSSGNIHDLLDCVVPIVNDSIDQLPAGQIVIAELQKIIKERFIFRIPTFSLEHVLGRLAQTGKVSYDSVQKAYFHDGVSAPENDPEVETATDRIAYLEQELAAYAEANFGINEPPYFSEWADVLVYFLHPDAVEMSNVVRALKGTLVSDFDDVIKKIASNFILYCESRESRKAFNIIIDVYGGILLGDFLQNIQSIGNPESFKDLVVFYDTSILLRLLGCSGAQLRRANMEMHRDLQTLGCSTEFLQHNEGELANILDTIVGRYDANLPIYGETGEALIASKDGVQIGSLKELRDGYPEALAALGLFPSRYTFKNTQTQNYFQIDELKFEGMLGKGSIKGYSDQNRINDTQSLAIVMRLRQSSRSNDLATSKYVFVTSNSHFARVARKFIQEELGFTSRYVPPVLTHSQISTAAWISSENILEDSSISRELVANCMSAQQLSKEWVDGFLEIMKNTDVSLEDNTILHAVRSIARDESLGNPTILRKLNPTEILKRAQAAAQEQAETLKKSHEEDLSKRLAESEQSIRQEERESQADQAERRSEVISTNIIRVLDFLLVFPFTYILINGLGRVDANNYFSFIQPALFTIVTAIAVMDLFQFKPVRRLTEPFRRVLKNFIMKTFYH